MFSKQERSYMLKLGINANFQNPTQDELYMIEEAIGDRLATHGFDGNYKPTFDGVICEKILDKLIRF